MKWISDRRNTISRSKNATGGIGSETLGPSSNFVDGITKSDKQDINIADMVPSSITSSSIDNNSDIQNSASRSSLPSSIASTTSKQSTTPSITTNDSASFHTTDSGSNNTIRFHQELEVIQQEMIGMEQIKSMILDQNDLDLDIGAENMWKSISCETIAVDIATRDEKSSSRKSSLDSEVDLIEFESPFVVYSRQLDVLGRLEQDPLDSRSITVEETKEEADSLELKFDLKHEHSYFENSELLTSKIIVKYGADYVISLLARAWKESFLKQYE